MFFLCLLMLCEGCALHTNTRLTTVNAYDFLDRMTSILSTPSGTNMAPGSLSYLYNDLNQRTAEVTGDGSKWVYGYDYIGQLTSGKKSWGDNMPVAGQQFEYVYDDIGNRKSTKEGGDSNGSNLRSATYTANTLNQYTTRSVPSKVDVLGNSTSTSTVQVNSNNADNRHGPYFQKELTVSNTGTNAIWQSVTVSAGTNSATGNLFIPGTTQNFAYDADGNLTNDYTWAYIYNGENQLTEVRPLTNSPAASKKWLTFTYDYAGRRIGKTAAYWTNAAWVTRVNNRFLYDRWNLIAELNATNNALIRGYLWGQDLSGTIHGAGGVGGLLAINDPVNGAQFVTHDAKGNVTALVSASTGAYTALYEYDPYGRVLRATGPMASKNPFHFSDKYEDTEVGLTYYGDRYYNASVGRWHTRDPIGEWGAVNLYQALFNNPLSFIDSIGDDNFYPTSSELAALSVQNAPVVGTFTLSAIFVQPMVFPSFAPPGSVVGVPSSSQDWVSGQPTFTGNFETGSNFAPADPFGLLAANALQQTPFILSTLASEGIGAAIDAFDTFTALKCLKSANVGDLGGKLVDPKKLDRLKQILQKHKTFIKVDSKYMDKYRPDDYAVFERLPLGGSRIVLRNDATEYHLSHELKHWGDYNRLGAEEFQKILPNQHEESAFKYIQKQKWLTTEEAAHAEAYIQSIRQGSHSP